MIGFAMSFALLTFTIVGTTGTYSLNYHGCYLSAGFQTYFIVGAEMNTSPEAEPFTVGVGKINDHYFHNPIFCFAKINVSIIMIEEIVPMGKYQSVKMLIISPNIYVQL